ncbi:MAG TPA: nuclear transport factor 2 family protein [Candidatus Sulfotelmatobacter sp.]|nr:nuclear transport factor 2 family protein [Candidatus Sulfotelmatobacter sp.]
MRTLFSIVSMLLVASLIKAQGAIQTGGEESRILTLEVAWNQAVQSRDAKALRILLAPEVVYIDYDGTVMDREQYLASVDSPPNVPLQIVNESMTVRMYGAVAVVNGVYRETGAKNGKPYLHRERFTDTWVREGGSWLCVASQSTLIAR